MGIWLNKEKKIQTMNKQSRLTIKIKCTKNIQTTSKKPNPCHKFKEMGIWLNKEKKIQTMNKQSRLTIKIKH